MNNKYTEEYIEILKKQKQIIESEGHKVALICLYGSQNYDLDIFTEEYKSDIDMKAIIIPTLDDLINNAKPISKVIKTQWGECDIKDIRNYFEVILKANPTYIETLFTNYLVVDEDFKEEFEEVFSHKDRLVEVLRVQYGRAMYGMMCEKEKALCHPYPSTQHKIEQFGYDGKQAHHILRMLYMMNDYFIDKKPISDAFYPQGKRKSLLMKLKLNEPTLEEVKVAVFEYMSEARNIRDSIISKIIETEIDYSIEGAFLKLSQKIIRTKIVNEIRGE